MESWQAYLVLGAFGAVVNFVIAFVLLQVLAGWVGVDRHVNTPGRAFSSLLTIVPLAGVAGAPFFLIPFIGPPLGTFVSACVAPLLLAQKYSVTQAVAAKVILPTVALVAILWAFILYVGYIGIASV